MEWLNEKHYHWEDDTTGSSKDQNQEADMIPVHTPYEEH